MVQESWSEVINKENEKISKWVSLMENILLKKIPEEYSSRYGYIQSSNKNNGYLENMMYIDCENWNDHQNKKITEHRKKGFAAFKNLSMPLELLQSIYKNQFPNLNENELNIVFNENKKAMDKIYGNCGEKSLLMYGLITSHLPNILNESGLTGTTHVQRNTTHRNWISDDDGSIFNDHCFVTVSYKDKNAFRHKSLGKNIALFCNRSNVPTFIMDAWTEEYWYVSNSTKNSDFENISELHRDILTATFEYSYECIL